MLRSHLTIPESYRSPEAASFVVQLDDQLALLRKDTADLTPADLEWQPARGMNTIGMLLAHMAIVEVWWLKIGIGREEKPAVDDVLGIDVDDDGMPIKPDAEPAATLRGKNIAFYHDLLDRARAYTKRLAAEHPPEELDRELIRTRQDGSQRAMNVRWVYYHVLEHFAGHYGQILLLKHMREDAVKRV
jgi:uncharacterized damage-inducible protein DinB